MVLFGLMEIEQCYINVATAKLWIVEFVSGAAKRRRWSVRYDVYPHVVYVLCMNPCPSVVKTKDENRNNAWNV